MMQWTDLWIMGDEGRESEKSGESRTFDGEVDVWSVVEG